MEAVQLPEKVAIMHCKVHQRGESLNEVGNTLSDREAKKTEEEGPMEMHPLVPDSKIQIGGEPKYFKEVQKLTDDLEERMEKGGWAITPQGKIIVSALLWAVVIAEHRKTH